MEKETAITAKLVTIPAGIEVAKIFGVPINDFATYMAIFVSCLVALDYIWRFYIRWQSKRDSKNIGVSDGD